MQQIFIGYWNNNKNDYPQYSLPVENSATNEEIFAATKLIAQIEAANNSVVLYCKGASVCRICGKSNGSQEIKVVVYSNKKVPKVVYVLAQGYLHYIQEHRVKPDLDLLRAMHQACSINS